NPDSTRAASAAPATTCAVEGKPLFVPRMLFRVLLCHDEPPDKQKGYLSVLSSVLFARRMAGWRARGLNTQSSSNSPCFDEIQNPHPQSEGGFELFHPKSDVDACDREGRA